MASNTLILYFLQASRSIRIAWLLEELSVPYISKFYPRENNKAPAAFKEESGNPLGKAPCIRDGDLVVNESGAITEYLIEKYDPDQRMLGGQDPAIRNKVRTWIHASEGTFMIHALAITYARWFAPKPFQDQPDQMKEFEKGLAVNVCKDLDWLNDELREKRFLVGEKLTAADTMVLMSIQFIFARDLCGGKKQSEWKEIDRWIGVCEGTASWKKAVEKTGHEI